MHKEFTESDLMKEAKEVVLLLNVKSTNYKYNYLDHVLIVQEDEYDNYTSIKVKMEKISKKQKTKEVLYENKYL